MVTKNLQKMQENYICNNCDFITSNKYNYLKHLSTLKHKNSENDNNGNKKMQKNALCNFVCENCKKSYIYKSGLSRHKKTCITILGNNIETSGNEIIENNDFQNIEMDKLKSKQNCRERAIDRTARIGRNDA